MQDRNDLARTILQMNYGELLVVASGLSQMRDADVRPKIETPQEFADALFDWAEAQASDAHS